MAVTCLLLPTLKRAHGLLGQACRRDSHRIRNTQSLIPNPPTSTGQQTSHCPSRRNSGTSSDGFCHPFWQVNLQEGMDWCRRHHSLRLQHYMVSSLCEQPGLPSCKLIGELVQNGQEVTAPKLPDRQRGPQVRN